MKTMRPLIILLGALGVLTGCTNCGGGQTTAAGPAPPPIAPDRPNFDRSQAFEALEQQCAFGVRAPGSTGHETCRAWLVSQLEQSADAVVLQDFTSRTPLGGPYEFQNILAVFGSAASGEPLLLGAHWDTRPIADEDPLVANRSQPILGANDGASGVAILLELARLMKNNAPPRPIIIALFDAEDSGVSGVTEFPYQGFCIGSDYLAGNWPASVTAPAEMVLLDLVGTDSVNNPRLQPDGGIDGPAFKLEGYSLSSAPRLVNDIWTVAENRGHSAFVRNTGLTVTDDHKPFIDRGIPAVDIIHFAPAEWHTIDDTPQHCSAETLYQVGDTLIGLIWGS